MYEGLLQQIDTMDREYKMQTFTSFIVHIKQYKTSEKISVE